MNLQKTYIIGIVVVEGKATTLFSDDGHVTITEEICTLTSTQEETDSRIILLQMDK